MGFGYQVVTWFFIVKSCFLLNLKDVVLTVIVTGVAQSLILASNIIRFFPTTGLQSIREGCSNFDKYYNLQQLVRQSILQNLAIYIAISTITVWICFLMIAERKSRQKAEALTQQVETLAATLERTRIARDIHDSLGHTLTSLDVQLELAIKLHSRNPEQSLQALETAKLMAFQSVQNVRTSVRTMRESDFDLHQALVALIEQVKQNQSFKMQLEMNLPQLPLQTSYQLYCVIQEALTNIQKHSKASLVSLRIQPTSEALSLELVDNGIGFDMLAPRSGFGLRGMHERIHSLGGELIVNSSPGQGTHVQVTIPL
jgi:signal transduction histidine kinase